MLALLFAVCMKGLLATLNDEKPKWILEESLIGTNPGIFTDCTIHLKSSMNVLTIKLYICYFCWYHAGLPSDLVKIA